MKVKITPFKACGKIVAPPSKSFAHRYLIAAFLSGKRCEVLNAGESDDINATVGVLKSLGGDITRRGKDIIVAGRVPVRSAKADCFESGSTMRFLLPVAAALGISATFTGGGKLLSRPIEDLVKAVSGHGAKINGHTVSGKLQSGVYHIDGSLSSQFISGLLFALSVLDGESEIVLTGERVSAGYIDITVGVLREFGVKIDKTPAGYKVTGGYSAKDKVTVEGDWSGAAFMLSVGALTGCVTVKNLRYPSLQADAKIVEILRKFGAKVEINGDGVTAKKGANIGGGEIDCENCPDIAQVICSVAAFSKGETLLTGVKRLKLKESDRIAAIINTLSSCGIRATAEENSITVFGGKPKGAEFSGGADHRTVMSAAVIAAAAEGVSTISGAEYCAKSYPDFFKDLKAVGGSENVDF